MGGAKRQMERDSAPSGWLSAADYNEAVRDNAPSGWITIPHYNEPYETTEDICKRNQVKDDLHKVTRNYMKKWSKEDDEKLMRMLDDCVEQDKIINYDDEFRMEFGRTAGALISRFKKLIFENYDESCWEDCRKAIGLNQYAWRQFLDSQKRKDAEKETNKHIMAQHQLDRIKKKN